MPSSPEILANLTSIANGSLLLAIGWHLALLAGTAALMTGWRPSRRTAATVLLGLPASVGALAFTHGNPFNGTMFMLLTVILGSLVRRLDRRALRLGDSWAVWLGTGLLVYGFVYPHFLEGQPLLLYAIAAPTGLVPCPTLAVLIGFTLLADRQFSPGWTFTLAAFGLFYAAFGMLRLGVVLDAGLLVGVAALIGATVADSRRSGSPSHTPAAAAGHAGGRPA